MNSLPICIISYVKRFLLKVVRPDWFANFCGIDNTKLFCRLFKLNTIPLDDLENRLTSSKDRHLDTMAKYNYAIFLLLQEIYNFR